MNRKLITSERGAVDMAGNEIRQALRNTYRVTSFTADGADSIITEDVRIEFELDTNATLGGRRFRKASPKQAATFRLTRAV